MPFMFYTQGMGRGARCTQQLCWMLLSFGLCHCLNSSVFMVSIETLLSLLVCHTAPYKPLVPPASFWGGCRSDICGIIIFTGLLLLIAVNSHSSH
ncbi:hypothetical protein COO60DRAFT_21997 [Scenedesmus sp. NREL 46B-D3]|nr:hypothetical protein COO60DRAFT_21997 [Scenedesmus sp. NREL 46B-D3]